jgi:ribosomal protein S18 acetylase RimI-like enzyme
LTSTSSKQNYQKTDSGNSLLRTKLPASGPSFNDAEIWEERDCNDAIYIHRIATHSDFRGHNFVKIIVDWAKYAKSIGKDYIRLDTLGNNLKLIEHYTIPDLISWDYSI